MALPTGGYSFTPREVNLGASPLTALKPINVAEGLSVTFTPMPKYEVPSAKEELVSMGAAKAFETIGTEAANAVKAKEAKRLADEEKQKERDFQKTEKGLDRANALAIAQQRGYKTDAELSTESLRNEVLRKRLEADKEDTINYGTFDLPTRTQKVEDNAPSLWDLGAVDNNTAYSTQPSPELLNSLLNIPPSQLMASAGGAGQAQLQGINAVYSGSIVPQVQQVSTDTMPVQAGVSPEPQYGAMAKYRGIYSPEETKAIRDEFYNKFGESPSGVNMQFDKPLANAPKIIPKATAIQQQEQPQDGLGRYMQTWADPSIAAKAADKVAEMMGPGFAYPEVEQVKTKRGEVGYKVKYPKKLTAKQIAEEGGLEKPSFQDEKALRQEFIGNSKDYKTVQSAWRSIKAAGERKETDEPSPAADMALIFAYMKLLDPNSTVREGEYATAQNATGIPGRIQNLYNNAVDGLILNAKQRDDFLGQSKKQYDARLNEYKSLKNYYSKLAKRKGFDPEDIIVEFDITDEVPLMQDLQGKMKDSILKYNSLPEGAEKEKAKAELLKIRQQVQNLGK